MTNDKPMKINDLIWRLQYLKELHGNLPVYHEFIDYYEDIQMKPLQDTSILFVEKVFKDRAYQLHHEAVNLETLTSKDKKKLGLIIR